MNIFLKNFSRVLRNTISPNLIDCPNCNSVLDSNLDYGILTYINVDSMAICPNCKTQLHCTRGIPNIKKIYYATEMLPIETKIVGELLFFILNMQSTILESQYNKYKQEIIAFDNLTVKQQSTFDETHHYFYSNRTIENLYKQIDYTKKLLPDFNGYWSKRLELIRSVCQIESSSTEEQLKVLDKIANDFSISKYKIKTPPQNTKENNMVNTTFSMDSIVEFQLKHSTNKVKLRDIYDEAIYGNEDDFFNFINTCFIIGKATLIDSPAPIEKRMDDNFNNNSYSPPKNSNDASQSNTINIKLFNKDNADELQTLIYEATNYATKPLLNNSAKYRAELRNILNKKLKRTNYDNNEYVQSLINNVTFYTAVLPNVKFNFETALKRKMSLTKEHFDYVIFQIQDEYKKPGYQLTDDYIKGKNTYMSIMPINKRITDLEFDYMYYYTYSTILYELIDYLLVSPKYNILFNYNPTHIIELLDKNIKFYTCDILGVLETKLN